LLNLGVEAGGFKFKPGYYVFCHILHLLKFLLE
jgi:hypothetical protein